MKKMIPFLKTVFHIQMKYVIKSVLMISKSYVQSVLSMVIIEIKNVLKLTKHMMLFVMRLSLVVLNLMN